MKVLVIEDEKLVAESIRAILEHKGDLKWKQCTTVRPARSTQSWGSMIC